MSYSITLFTYSQRNKTSRCLWSLNQRDAPNFGCYCKWREKAMFRTSLLFSLISAFLFVWPWMLLLSFLLLSAPHTSLQQCKVNRSSPSISLSAAYFHAVLSNLRKCSFLPCPCLSKPDFDFGGNVSSLGTQGCLCVRSFLVPLSHSDKTFGKAKHLS